jgi:N-acetylglucosaminyl-diphospho-decaprenol L-rhamnosyltransferase
MCPEVSVIIVSWNTKDILLDCLRSLYEQTKSAMQVIVVDNASVDGSADAVESAFPQVNLIRSDVNLGFAKGNNRGLEVATGNHILYLNPDTIILDGAIDKMLRYLEAHPGIGVLGPHTFNADGCTTQDTVIFKPTLRRMFHTHVPVWRLIPGWRPELAGQVSWHRTGIVEVVKGCCLLMPADLVSDLGGMSEKHFMYSEEEDLCSRAMQRGFATWYYHEASIIHLGGEATKQNSEVMVKAQVEAWTDVFRQSNPESSVAMFRLLLGFGSLWRWLAWASVALVPTKRELARQRMREHVATLKALTTRNPKI